MKHHILRSRKAKRTKQSHSPPGLCLCSVSFAMCKKIKKALSVLIFRRLYCIFDHLFLILKIHGEEIKSKNIKSLSGLRF